MELLRNEIDSFALANGLPVNGFRLIIALASCSIIAPSIYVAPNADSRHALNILFGLLIGWLCFEYAVIHTIGTGLAVYMLLHILQPETVGKTVLCFLLMYLAGCHYYREFTNPDIVWDSSQMVLTLKLSSLAFNYGDGQLAKAKSEHKVVIIPPLLPFLGYIFFFPLYLVGPAIEYNDYLKWMSERRIAPFSVHFRNLFVLLFCGVGFFLSMVYDVDSIDDPYFYSDSSWLTQRFYMNFRVVLFRFRFYLAWGLAEMASTIAGVGFVEATGTWSGVTNNDILCVEVPTNVRVSINSWNKGVAQWCNRYIYRRVGLASNEKPTVISTMAAFFTSALWHGLSPGYYLFFITGGIYIEAGKILRRRLRSYFHYTEIRSAHPHTIFLTYWRKDQDGNRITHPFAVVYDVVGVVITWTAMQYAGLAFVVLDIHRCFALWHTWYFLPHICAIVILIGGHLTKVKASSEVKAAKRQ